LIQKDWQAMLVLGHRVVDDMIAYLEIIREHPIWQAIPERKRANLNQPLPLEPQGAEQAYEDFCGERA
jgi:aromatic-L-amino-acid decarboxylase